MPSRRVLMVVPFVALALGLGLYGSAGASQGGGSEGGGGHAKSQLAQYMGEINGAVKTISKAALEEGGREQALAELARIQKVVLEAKAEVPATVASIEDEKKRAEKAAGFRMEMNVLLRGLLEVEDGVLAGDEKAVKKGLRALSETKDEGHAEFKGKGDR